MAATWQVNFWKFTSLPVSWISFSYDHQTYINFLPISNFCGPQEFHLLRKILSWNCKQTNFFKKNTLKQSSHIWWRSTRQKQAQTPYVHLSECIKWSLNYHLSIFQYEVTHKMTTKSQKVKTSIDNNHLIYLSDHLSILLKWKYGVRAF